MKNIGCTTPFGLNLDNICTDQNLGKQAYKLYEEYIRHQNYQLKECLYQCNFLNIVLTPQLLRRNDSKNKTSFVFEEYIKVSKSSFAYTELELLAELGGYVGLFMGLSVFDLRFAIDRIFKIHH